MNRLSWSHILTFLRAHAQRDTQSPFWFLSRYLWIIFAILTYSYLFKAHLAGGTVPLGKYGIDYPLFLITGVALARLVLVSLKVYDGTLAYLKQTGMLEWVLVTPTSVWPLFFAYVLWTMFLTVTDVAAVIASSHFLIGIPIKPFRNLTILTSAVLMCLSYAGIGMMVSGLVLLIGRGGFLLSFISQVSLAFGGVFYPTHLLPPLIERFVHLLPVTYALKIIRASLAGASFEEQSARFTGMAVMACGLLAAGVSVLSLGLRWARQSGLWHSTVG